MGHLLDQMEKVAYFAEEAMMEKLADRASDEAKRKARNRANKAGAKANKAVAASLQQGQLLPELKRLDLDANELADAAESMTPRNLARAIEKYTGKDALKSLQEGTANQAFDPQRELERVQWDAERRIKKNNRATAELLEAKDNYLSRALREKDKYVDQMGKYFNEARQRANAKVNTVRAHGNNRARNLIETARNLKDELGQAQHSARFWQRESADNLRMLEKAWDDNLNLSSDLKNFKNLGRFSGAAKWIQGNPRKALATAILGGGGLLGGAGAAGYALNNGPKPAPKPANLGS